jgi:hypothetical protein
MYSLRNKLSVTIIFLLALVLVTSCNDKDQGALVYFNIDSLIDANVAYLREAQPMLEKRATVAGKASVVTIIPKDSASWANELDIFREIDRINKPINRGSYKMEKDLKDSGSNLTIYRFTATSDLPLKFVEIYYQNSLSHIKKVKASYSEQNRLYSSSRDFSLEMGDVYNKNVITSYFIRGGQEMVFGDSVHFEILGNVVFLDKK